MKSRRRRPKEHVRPLGRVSSHFNGDGAPKSTYRSQAEARAAAQVSWVINGVDLNSYRCDFCNQWHNGKPFRND